MCSCSSLLCSFGLCEREECVPADPVMGFVSLGMFLCGIFGLTLDKFDVFLEFTVYFS